MLVFSVFLLFTGLFLSVESYDPSVHKNENHNKVQNEKLKEEFDFDDPCCSFPCQNGGICVSDGPKKYTCDCTNLEFHGQNCEIPTLWKSIKIFLKPRPETLQYFLSHYDWLWDILNNLSFINRRLTRYIYLTRGGLIDSPPRFTSGHDYITLEAYYNTSYYSRTLPPVPRNCPTPLGTAGKKTLPDIDVVVEEIFRRRTFKPEPSYSNVLFAFYAQHFTHQFFKTDHAKGPGFTWASDGVDASHIYGKDVSVQNGLRSFKDGKLKTSVINGEEYPPLLKDTPGVEMTYPPHVPETRRFALGHPFFALLPGLFVYSTIWMREHNRVCDVLRAEHPTWSDERLFQTVRLIIVGEIIKITIEDYVQHLSQYQFKFRFLPDVIHGDRFQYSNRIRAEFNHLYHWHPLFPDTFNVSGKTYQLKELAYSVEHVFEHGFTEFVDAMVNERAGELTHHNHGEFLLPVLKRAMGQTRQLRFQSFNQYRKRFGLVPYKTMEQLTGETEMASKLTELYGDIDGVEFYVGLLVEKKASAVTPPSMVEMGGPYSVKGLISNPICSPGYWKPSTFGGDTGFDIVREATLEKLFCNNLRGPCPRISFRMSDEQIGRQKNVKSEL